MEIIIKDIFGNIKDLKANCLKAIKQLQKAHVLSDVLVDLALCRKLNQAVSLSHRMIGVLLNRKGEVVWVIVGDSNRLYLPDIGRSRGAKDRLRGLRLVVSSPSPLNLSKIKGLSYAVHKDFITDLEKLRLDAVIEIDASKFNSEGPVVVANLFNERQDNGDYLLISQEKNYKNINAIAQNFSDFLQPILDSLKISESNSFDINIKDKAFLVSFSFDYYLKLL